MRRLLQLQVARDSPRLAARGQHRQPLLGAELQPVRGQPHRDLPRQRQLVRAGLRPARRRAAHVQRVDAPGLHRGLRRDRRAPLRLVLGHDHRPLARDGRRRRRVFRRARPGLAQLAGGALGRGPGAQRACRRRGPAQGLGVRLPRLPQLPARGGGARHEVGHAQRLPPDAERVDREADGAIPLRAVPPLQVRDLQRRRPLDAPSRLRHHGLLAKPGRVQKGRAALPRQLRRRRRLALQPRLCHDHRAHRAERVCARRRLRRRRRRRLHGAQLHLPGARLRLRRRLQDVVGAHLRALGDDRHRHRVVRAQRRQLLGHPARARARRRAARLCQRRLPPPVLDRAALAAAAAQPAAAHLSLRARPARAVAAARLSAALLRGARDPATPATRKSERALTRSPAPPRTTRAPCRSAAA